ncbi:MAG TPA: thioredoxin family protein, partial [Tepidisphaeraceae bacterium]|nr:thioredoxin family protein [Tepidisphaeraceae bacterium]
VYFARTFIERINHSETFFWGLLFLMVIIAAAFLFIRAVQLSPNVTPRLVAAAVALIMVGGAGYVTRWLIYQPFQWTPYTQAGIDAARANQRIVLVEFTATWCANCQYLEKTVLHSAPIVQQVRQKGIVMLRADVTRDDAPARPLLERLNPAGSIPLTVIYPPNGSEPIELTGIYSTNDLQHAIDLASRSATAMAVR